MYLGAGWRGPQQSPKSQRVKEQKHHTAVHLLFWDEGLFLGPGGLQLLGCLTSEPWRSFCLCLPTTGITDSCYCAQILYVLGIELRASWLHGNHFTKLSCPYTPTLFLNEDDSFASREHQPEGLPLTQTARQKAPVTQRNRSRD